MSRKNDVTKFSRHHRKLKSHGGNTGTRNISIVPSHRHRAYHILFADMKTHEIAEYLNDVWIDPDYRLIVTRRE